VSAAFSYGAGVYLKGDKFKIHVNILLELYTKYLRKGSKAEVINRIAGLDFNPDRICMAIIDRKGTIRDVKNEHFPEVTSRGFTREESGGIRA